MNNTRAWEEYYLQYYKVDEIEPLSVEELNKLWIEMTAAIDVGEQYLDWMQVMYAQTDPVSTAMSVEELNEIYVNLYAGVEKAEIKVFPTFNSLLAERKLA